MLPNDRMINFLYTFLVSERCEDYVNLFLYSFAIVNITFMWYALYFSSRAYECVRFLYESVNDIPVWVIEITTPFQDYRNSLCLSYKQKNGGFEIKTLLIYGTDPLLEI